MAELRRPAPARRSLRSARCQSTIVTEKERSLLTKAERGASQQGFVKSMCRFYSDLMGSGEKKRGLLDRSVSFTAGKEAAAVVEPASPLSSRAGSFRLNRSRSWRGSSETDTPKRNSPTGQSVRSQDSGFSDSGENCAAETETAADSPRSCPAGERKLFVTKINIDAERDNEHSELLPQSCSQPGNQSTDNFLYEAPMSENFGTIKNRRTGTTPVARQKVNGSLENIVSLQEGLKIKLETEPRTLYNQGCDANMKRMASRGSGAGGAVTAAGAEEAGQAALSPDPAPRSGPMFSTPVRASFRRRPKTMICLDEAQTPVKRESRTRLKEIKSRRRWSNIDQDQSKLSPLSVSTSNPRNSSSQYRNNLNSDACYEFRNDERRNSHLSPSLTVLSQISPVQSCRADETRRGAGQAAGRDGSGQLVDGTGTRLMLDTFLLGRSANTIFPLSGSGLHCDTIIEHDSCGLGAVECVAAGRGSVSPPVPPPSQSSRPAQDPVYEWWKDLFAWTEPECMTYLQSKPVPTAAATTASHTLPIPYYPYETVRATLHSKRAVAATFSALKRWESIVYHRAAINNFPFQPFLSPESSPNEQDNRTAHQADKRVCIRAHAAVLLGPPGPRHNWLSRPSRLQVFPASMWSPRTKDGWLVGDCDATRKGGPAGCGQAQALRPQVSVHPKPAARRNEENHEKFGGSIQ